MKIRTLLPEPILDETRRVDDESTQEGNLLAPTVIGTVALKAFVCRKCGARRSWDWAEVTEQAVVVVCLNCGTHDKIRGDLMDALLANTDFILPQDVER